MSTKKRRQREFVERESRILAKAWELLERDGLLKLQMSRLAEECEYSVGTLYHHFSSKEDMLLALATEQVSERLRLFEKVAQWQANTRDRMIGFLFADALFARREPLFFHLQQYITTPVIAAAISEERRQLAIEAHRPLAELFLSVVEEAQSNGDLGNTTLSPLQLGLGLWALAEGMHTLVHAEGLSEPYKVSSPYSLLLNHCHAWLNGHEWRPLYPLNDLQAQAELIDRVRREVFDVIPGVDAGVLFPQPAQGAL
ncbi:MAG: TetR family transcriptional regulator [Porticoccaceae bacterium]|nr:TetR family transcriptional regulator [Porticoccaceae bacterium]